MTISSAIGAALPLRFLGHFLSRKDLWLQLKTEGLSNNDSHYSNEINLLNILLLLKILATVSFTFLIFNSMPKLSMCKKLPLGFSRVEI